MQPSQKRTDRAAYRSSSAWVRQLARDFPDYAAVMPDPQRMPLFVVSGRSAVQAFREQRARIEQGGRAYAR
jgi:hypothetical protein